MRDFRPGWFGLTLCISLVGLFFSQHVLKLGMRPLVVFPCVLSLALLPLYCHRRSTGSSAHRRVFADGCHVSRIAIIGLIPITATVVYLVAVAVGPDRLPINVIVYCVLGGPAGFVLLVLAVSSVAGRVLPQGLPTEALQLLHYRCRQTRQDVRSMDGALRRRSENQLL